MVADLPFRHFAVWRRQSGHRRVHNAVAQPFAGKREWREELGEIADFSHRGPRDTVASVACRINRSLGKRTISRSSQIRPKLLLLTLEEEHAWQRRAT